MPTFKPPINVLPHRPPFLLVDEVLECSETRVRATRTFRSDEYYFEGHFPGNPIVPGVLLVEAMAQTFAYLVMTQKGTQAVYLTGVDQARFRKPVRPGDKVEFCVDFMAQRMGLISAKGEAWVDGERVASAKLTGAKMTNDKGESSPAMVKANK